MRILFWNVDTQKDFMNHNGALAIPEAGTIRQALADLTVLARDNNIQVVNTMDCHTMGDAELSDNPDFFTTFPPHCMSLTEGIDFISETNPDNPYFIDYISSMFDNMIVANRRNLIICKNKFDVFEGNPFTRDIVSTINPDITIVYGVASDICVDKAVMGLISLGRHVHVVVDAIKEIDKRNSDFAKKKWIENGVTITNLETVKTMFGVEEEPKEEEKKEVVEEPKKEETVVEPIEEKKSEVEEKIEEAPKEEIEKKEEVVPLETPKKEEITPVPVVEEQTPVEEVTPKIEEVTPVVEEITTPVDETVSPVEEIPEKVEEVKEEKTEDKGE